jgi:hypothetical protein
VVEEGFLLLGSQTQDSISWAQGGEGEAAVFAGRRPCLFQALEGREEGLESQGAAHPAARWKKGKCEGAVTSAWDSDHEGTASFAKALVRLEAGQEQ